MGGRNNGWLTSHPRYDVVVPHPPVGWVPFCYHGTPFCYQNTRILPYSTRILPVFYTFPKTDRILQNTSRTHKNTQEYEHVEECERHIHRKCENTTEYRQNTASRWYSLRIHTEYGGLQNTTQEYRAEYARNTQKNTVFFIVFRIRQRIRYRTCRIRAEYEEVIVCCVCSSLSALPRSW